MGLVVADGGGGGEVVKPQLVTYLTVEAEQAIKEVVLEARVGATNLR